MLVTAKPAPTLLPDKNPKHKQRDRKHQPTSLLSAIHAIIIGSDHSTGRGAQSLLWRETHDYQQEVRPYRC